MTTYYSATELENVKQIGTKFTHKLLTRLKRKDSLEQRFIWRCINGHKFKKSLYTLVYYPNCPKCDSLFHKTVEDCKKLGESKNLICLSTEYINTVTKLKWQCKKAGHIFMSKFSTINSDLVTGGCARCSGNAKHTIEDCQVLALSRNGKCLSDKYENNIKKLLWQCEKGHRWHSSWNHVNNYDAWCPKCVHFISKAEDEIFQLVKTKYPDALQNQSSILPNKRFRLDIYVPSLKKAIEYDGDYWHSAKNPYYKPEKDRMKNKECKQAGISLLRIKECDFNRDKELCIKRVFAFLN